jgi:hypothetical protein
MKIYNLAAQSHVQVSFETPEYTAIAKNVQYCLVGRAPPAAFEGTGAQLDYLRACGQAGKIKNASPGACNFVRHAKAKQNTLEGCVRSEESWLIVI